MHLTYRILADVVVVIHAAFALSVVVGLVLIVVGAARRWQWVRHRWFRVIHLSMIGFVVAESWVGVTCPLTTWENALREKAGQAAYTGGFIANAVDEWLYFDLPPWAFTVVYSLFGAAVLATFLLVPPRWRNAPAIDEALPQSEWLPLPRNAVERRPEHSR